ncbi:hypothetical protein ACIO8G_20125 [Streptomyces sp. NPDC087219]|uniref:hypothetical protein n=1 Tax=unclassified Streptomyces TaxID=2593676 RepID=UPI0038090D5B
MEIFFIFLIFAGIVLVVGIVGKFRGTGRSTPRPRPRRGSRSSGGSITWADGGGGGGCGGGSSSCGGSSSSCGGGGGCGGGS